MQVTFVAQNRVRKSIAQRDQGSSFVLQIWDYMVEVRGALTSRSGGCSSLDASSGPRGR